MAGAWNDVTTCCAHSLREPATRERRGKAVELPVEEVQRATIDRVEVEVPWAGERCDVVDHAGHAGSCGSAVGGAEDGPHRWIAQDGAVARGRAGVQGAE